MNKKVLKNAAWIIGCRIVQVVFALVINILQTRELKPDGFGQLSYAISICAFMLPIVRLGIENVLVNEFIRHPEEEGKIMGTSLLLTFISSLVCIGGAAAFVAVANPNEPVTLIVCVLYSLLLIAQSLDLVQYWFQAKYLSKYTSLTILLTYIVITAYKIFLLVTHKSIYWYAVSNALDYGIISAVLMIIYRVKGGQRMTFSWQTAKRVFDQSKHYILPQLMVAVYAQSGTLLLKALYDTETVGFYSLAVTISGYTNFFFVAIIDSMRPLIFESKLIGEKPYRDNVTALYSIVTYLALAQSVVISLAAGWLIPTLYGSNYNAAVLPTQIIIWYSTFSYIGSVRNVWMLAEKKQRYLWIINMGGAIVNVGLNLVLIPALGAVGAAITALITQIFTNVIMSFFIKPIRESNLFLLRGLDPRYLKRLVMVLFHRKGRKKTAKSQE